MAIEQKPVGIDCPKWEAVSPGAKRCRYYEDATHLCGHELVGGDECSEFTKLRLKKATPSEPVRTQGAQLIGGASITRVQPALFKDPNDDGVRELAPAAGTPPGAATGGARQGAGVNAGLIANSNSNSGSGSNERRGLHRVIAGAIEIGLLAPPDFQPAKEIDPKSIEALESSIGEIVLRSQAMGGKDIVLVREVNSNDERLQISFRDAATIRLLVDSFPGAQVIDVRTVANTEIPF